jgi:hypothetical protein
MAQLGDGRVHLGAVGLPDGQVGVQAGAGVGGCLWQVCLMVLM